MYINTPNIRGCNVIFFFSLGVETENNAECQGAGSVKGINTLRKPGPPTLLSGARQSTVHFHRNVSATAGAKLFLNICFLSWTVLSPVHLPCCASPLRE